MMTSAKKSAMDSCYKLRHLFYYKLRQVLQSAMDLLQIATGITKCDDYYKLRQYTYSISFNSSNVGKFFWSWILKDGKVQEKKKKVVVFSSRPRQNVRLFSRCSPAATAKKCTKKRDARAKLLFYQSKSSAFLPFSLPSPSSLRRLFKMMLHETIRNNDFQRNTALQCWNNVATIWSNVATTL